ncbi:hypothetical protein R1sor_008137 [Riccia sorocarpa]|uniref:Diphthine--ammonia ligase n=1 Tax=Riccia sorocarpa TaxID=122646 RepID=A0ABD3HU64_9MARC
MHLCKSYGHEIVALANLYPVDESIDELDSYMYQTVGHQVITAVAQCIGLPLFRRKIQGQSRSTDLRYMRTDGDEVEDLEVLLRAVKSRFPDLQGVSTGAIASDYQRLRVENVCSRLGLISLAYMWKQEQPILLQNMIDSGLRAILVKVAAMGLDPHKHLGKELSSLQPLLMRLQEAFVEVVPFTCVMRPLEEFSDGEDEEPVPSWREIRTDNVPLQEALKRKFGEDVASGKLSQDGGLHTQQQFVCAPCKGLVLSRYFCRAVSHLLLTGGETCSEPSSCEVTASLNRSMLAGSLDLSGIGQTDDSPGKLENGIASEGESSLTSALSKSLYSLSLILKDASLSWDDVVVFRVYFVRSIISAYSMGKALDAAILKINDGEFRSQGSTSNVVPRPTLIPVLGVGESSKLEGVVGIEVTASGGLASKL